MSGHVAQHQRHSYLSHHQHDPWDNPPHLHPFSEVLGTGLLASFLSSLALDVNSSAPRLASSKHSPMLVSSPPLGTKHTWHELAHFASPAELVVGLQLGSLHILRVSVGSSCPHSNLAFR